MNYELLGILLTVVCQGLYVAYKMGKFEAKLINLEKNQNKHNNLIERTYKLEFEINSLKEKVNDENHRIDNLEDTIKWKFF